MAQQCRFSQTCHFVASGPAAGQYNLTDSSKLPSWRDRCALFLCLPFDTRTVLLLLLLLFVVSAYVLLTRRLPVCLPRSTRALITVCSATAMRFVGFALTAAPPASAHRTAPSVHWCETAQKTPFLEPFHAQSNLINLPRQDRLGRNIGKDREK